MMGLPIDEPADVWALGCMLYLLCYGSLPFTGESQLEVMAGKANFPRTRDACFGRTIAAMLHAEPVKRPNIHSVLAMIEDMKQALKGNGQLTRNSVDLEPRSLSATMKSETKSVTLPSQKKLSLHTQGSLPNSSVLKEAVQNSARQSGTVQRQKSSRASIDASAVMPAVRSQGNSKSPSISVQKIKAVTTVEGKSVLFWYALVADAF